MGVVKLVLVGGAFKSPKLEHFGPGICPWGFWPGTSNSSAKGPRQRRGTLNGSTTVNAPQCGIFTCRVSGHYTITFSSYAGFNAGEIIELYQWCLCPGNTFTTWDRVINTFPRILPAIMYTGELQLKTLNHL